jgi:hypothetical protein
MPFTAPSNAGSRTAERPEFVPPPLASALSQCSVLAADRRNRPRLNLKLDASP